MNFNSADDLWDYLSPTQLPIGSPDEFAYRGHANAAWTLTPTILRPDTVELMEAMWRRKLTTLDQACLEYQMLEIFVQCCDAAGISVPDDSEEFRRAHLGKSNFQHYLGNPTLWPNKALFRIMALAQLHGLPTRLLDWTTNPYVAVYFAASTALRSQHKWTENSRLAVWKWNMGPRDDTTYRHKSYGSTRVVRVPGSISDNIVAQQGLFTLHPLIGQRDDPPAPYSLDNDLSAQPGTDLCKLTIPVAESARLYHLCELVDHHAASLYPGTDGVSKNVMDRFWCTRAQSG